VKRTQPCWISATFLFIIICLWSPPAVYAGAYEWGGLGSRAQAMGGAYIGVADDWTAMYWNPAGLAQLQSWGGGIDFTSPNVTMSDGNSMANLLPSSLETRYQIDTFAQYSGLEPASFNQTEVEEQFYILSGAGVYWSLANFTLAVGYYVPAGYYIDWNDSIDFLSGNITAKLLQELSIAAMNLSVAREIIPGLALGVGFEVLYGKIDYEAYKTVAGTGIPGADYNWSMTSDADGIGYEGIFGIHYHATDWLSIGGVYRTGGTIDLKGDAQTQLSLIGLSESSSYEQQFRYPSTYGIGLAFSLPGQVLLSVDWQCTEWSDFNIDVKYNNTQSALTNKDYSADWRNSNRYRIGAEWNFSSCWAFRGGYFYDESPLPDKSVSLSNIVDVDRHNFILGVDYQITKAVDLGAIAHYAYGDRNVNGVDYSQRVHSFGLSLSCGF
jgi:long-chain fatty acid transport protein